MAVYTYRITFDAGSAPNPFWGICTLAICKPAIRRVARRGDWVLALGAKEMRHGSLRSGRVIDRLGTLVCAMQVYDPIPWAEYDRSYPQKRPAVGHADWRCWLGDNLYNHSARPPIQRDGVHSTHEQDKDLRGRYVLVARKFLYCGSDVEPIPEPLLSLARAYSRDRRKWVGPEEEAWLRWLAAVDLEWNRPLARPHFWPFEQEPSSLRVLSPDAADTGCSVASTTVSDMPGQPAAFGQARLRTNSAARCT